MSEKVKVLICGTVEMLVHQKVTMSRSELDRIKSASDRDLCCSVMSPLIDHIRWNDLEPSSLSIDELSVIDDDGKIIEQVLDE